MNAIEWYSVRDAYRKREAAIADSLHLIIEILRSDPDSGLTAQFLDRVISILEDCPGFGSYKKTMLIESGQEVAYSFSWTVGMMHLGSMRKYIDRFGDLPHWVCRRHPYHIHRLCLLAVEQQQPLPHIPEEHFSPENAEFIRDLKLKTDRLMESAIQAVQNRNWLATLGADLACNRRQLLE